MLRRIKYVQQLNMFNNTVLLKISRSSFKKLVTLNLFENWIARFHISSYSREREILFKYSKDSNIKCRI